MTNLLDLDPTQKAALDAYHERINGIPDCFDGIDHPAGTDAVELPGLADLLQRWWLALDALDTDLGGDDENPPSLAGRYRLHAEMDEWLRTRQRLLHVIARLHGIYIGQPDNPTHGVITSNNHRGWFGLHDHVLDDRLTALRAAELAADQADA